MMAVSKDTQINVRSISVQSSKTKFVPEKEVDLQQAAANNWKWRKNRAVQQNSTGYI